MWRLLSIVSAIAWGIYRVCRKSSESWIDESDEKFGGWFYEKRAPFTVEGQEKISKVYFGLKAPVETVQAGFTRETVFEKWVKLLGICREFQTDDPEFDDNVFVMADDQAVGDLLRLSPAVRQTIRELLTDKGFLDIRSITISGGFIWVEVAFGERRLCASVAVKLRADLTAIASALGRTETPATSSVFRFYRVLQIFNIALLAGIGVFFIASLFFDPFNILDTDRVRYLTLCSTAGYVLLYLGIIVTVFKKTSYASLLVRDLVLYGAATFALFSSQVVRTLNIELDTSKPVVHQIELVGSEEILAYAQNPNVCFLKVRELRNGAKVRWLEVPRHIYETFWWPGPMDVLLHKGYLGAQWIEYDEGRYKQMIARRHALEDPEMEKLIEKKLHQK